MEGSWYERNGEKQSDCKTARGEWGGKRMTRRYMVVAIAVTVVEMMSVTWRWIQELKRAVSALFLYLLYHHLPISFSLVVHLFEFFLLFFFFVCVCVMSSFLSCFVYKRLHSIEMTTEREEKKNGMKEKRPKKVEYLPKSSAEALNWRIRSREATIFSVGENWLWFGKLVTSEVESTASGRKWVKENWSANLLERWFRLSYT